MFRDAILQSLIKKYPAPHFEDRTQFLFEDLIESVISQQLSVKAADTIYKRFKNLYSQNKGVTRVGDPQKVPAENKVNDALVGGNEGQDPSFFPIPLQVLNTNDQSMRACGISFQKISYIKSIADAFLSDLIDTKNIQTMTDEEVIAILTQIRGVGRWTAEMILIFTLNRPDVFSLGDLGIRNAIKRLYGITDQKKILALAETWKPYRSTACWYLWRSLENV